MWRFLELGHMPRRINDLKMYMLRGSVLIPIAISKALGASVLDSQPRVQFYQVTHVSKWCSTPIDCFCFCVLLRDDLAITTKLASPI